MLAAWFDTGITEEHALGFAAGLATGGKKPVVAIYSTFMQRALDQVILDNAIEAQKSVEGEKKIELAFRENGKDRVIVCKNTVAAPVLANNKELKSTKKDPSSHGLGHIIVTRTVEKYGGMVDWFDLDGMFGVQVILPRS